MSNVEIRPLFYFFFKFFPDEEREEDLRLEEWLTLEREEEPFRLWDEYLFEVEILVLRDEIDLEKEGRC